VLQDLVFMHVVITRPLRAFARQAIDLLEGR
jgi:hypothetical protein